MTQLEKLRKEVDKVNQDLIKLVAKRFKITDKIKKLKLKNNLPIEDKNRELEIMKKAEKLSEKLQVDSGLIKNILSKIIEESKKRKQ